MSAWMVTWIYVCGGLCFNVAVDWMPAKNERSWVYFLAGLFFWFPLLNGFLIQKLFRFVLKLIM